jgi:DNA-binding MarR family transcriptional regulator
MGVEVAALRRSVQRLARRLRTQRPRGGLTGVQLGLLATIMDEGPQRPAELAARARTTPQALTRPLTALTVDGLLERHPDPDDGRQYLLTISDSGWAALAEDAAPRDAWLDRALADLTDAERDVLAIAARLLDRLAAHPELAEEDLR